MFRRFLVFFLAAVLGFGSASAATLSVNADPSAGFTSSPLLFGIFLEDINYAADGGLCAEMIKNGSFEYGSAALKGFMHGWSTGEGVSFTVEDGAADGSSLNSANPHYARILNESAAFSGILGNGYLDGLAVRAGEEYRASVFLRAQDGYEGPVRLALVNTSGKVFAEAEIPSVTSEWMRYSVSLFPDADADRSLRLEVSILPGTVDCDMVSLMPAETYAGLPVRKDLGEMLEALHPSFLRFPGGCAVEGRNPESIYSWKDSIGSGSVLEINGVPVTGDPAVRPRGLNTWSGSGQHPYYTSYTLGFYEYFCLCEALGCAPVPVLNAGMTCPVQSRNYVVYSVYSDEFRAFVQDALDLAEFCLGGPDTRWGAVRTAMGHPDPFPLTYIAVGNEQWQGEYYEHYLAFVEAFDEAAEESPEIYGGIRLIVANGPAASSSEGWDYIDGYAGAEDTRTTLVDEHYYMDPDWFLQNTHRYDSYERGLQATVFLGEFAARSNTLRAALAEAAFMTGLERNSDVVSLACYAPLFGNAVANQWTPDLIFFNRLGSYGTVNYCVQQLFMNHRVATVLPAELNTAEGEGPVYASAGLDAEGALVLKLVNPSATPVPLDVAVRDLPGVSRAAEAECIVLRGDSPEAANTFSDPERILPEEGTLPAGSSFTVPLSPFSLTVLILPVEP